MHNQQESKIVGANFTHFHLGPPANFPGILRHLFLPIYTYIYVCVCKDDSLLFLISLQKEKLRAGKMRGKPQGARENEAKDTATRSLSAKFFARPSVPVSTRLLQFFHTSPFPCFSTLHLPFGLN